MELKSCSLCSHQRKNFKDSRRFHRNFSGQRLNPLGLSCVLFSYLINDDRQIDRKTIVRVIKSQGIPKCYFFNESLHHIQRFFRSYFPGPETFHPEHHVDVQEPQTSGFLRPQSILRISHQSELAKRKVCHTACQRKLF